ncbi:RDD family protein [Niallia sp. Krafla_26]|uniref:RDD family protein n=1 Tax=Niallia sp. Krafla_26 TaxID=3064703 RepID=UPI003D1785C2
MNTTLENHSNEGATRFAGFWIRVGAYLIDSVILSIPIWIVSSIIFFLFLGTSDIFYYMMYDSTYMYSEISDAEVFSFMASYYTALIITIILNFIIAVAYFAGLHASKWQATIGKKLLGLKVTDLNGRRISFWRGFGRYAAMSFLSGIFFIGYIMVAFTEKKQGLHDMIASTIVSK